MDNVVAFPSRKTDGPTEQHGCGEAICIGCKHSWTAIEPTGTTDIECPQCGTMKGRWKFEFAPDIVRQCQCGNQYFYLTPVGHMCANCGIYQEYS